MEQRAVLYWVSNKPEIEQKVKEIEEEYDLYVYHVQLTHTKLGDMWAMLYVSEDDSEWEFEDEDFRNSCPYAYVWNETTGDGEFGTIQIRPSMGGVERIG